MTLKEQVIEMCKDLRLPSIRKLVKEETSFPHPEQAFKILHQVLVQEKEDRFIRAKQNRIRLANFPQKKLLEELSMEALPPQAQQKIPILKQLNFIKECQNVILTESPGTLRSFELKFEKYDLVIIDELGYISFDKEGAELLFTHLSLRAGRKSTIITSNLPFTKWNEVFHDQVLTAALTDRLTHKSHV